MDERSLKAGSFYDMGDKQYMGQSSIILSRCRIHCVNNMFYLSDYNSTMYY